MLKPRLFALAVALATPLVALAGPTSGAMPWSGPLEILKTDFLGPTLAAVALLALGYGGMKWAVGSDNRGLGTAVKALVVVAAVGGGGLAIFGALGINASPI